MRRSPHGERGLKYLFTATYGTQISSLPARGAWIEICRGRCTPAYRSSRSPHGERGLKFGGRPADLFVGRRRSPHGERGLKSMLAHLVKAKAK